MKNQLTQIIEFLKKSGVEYGDLRFTETVRERIVKESGQVERVFEDMSYGVGIRIIHEGSIGFAATHRLEEGLLCAEIAIEKARVQKDKCIESRLYKDKPQVRETVIQQIERDPFTTPLVTKLAVLQEAERRMMQVAGVTYTLGTMEFIKIKKIFMDTENNSIEQHFYRAGAGIEAVASDETDTQVRSYPNSFGGTYGSGGLEFVMDLDLVENSERIAREAVDLLHAEECPKGEMDLIIDGTQMSIQIHESIGHALELDRILGYEAGFAGKSFVKISDQPTQLRYGSELLTVKSQPHLEGGLGHFQYDDDGIRTKEASLIEKGILKGFITDIATAAVINKESDGNALCEDWRFAPLTRMTNINLLPGQTSVEELIKKVDYGLYYFTNKSWSIDDYRSHFKFGCEIAYEISKGQLTGKLFKNPVYSGSTLTFWASCVGIANEADWKIHGIPDCGKGEPYQNAMVAHGASSCLFKNINVGASENA